MRYFYTLTSNPESLFTIQIVYRDQQLFCQPEILAASGFIWPCKPGTAFRRSSAILNSMKNSLMTGCGKNFICCNFLKKFEKSF